MRRCCWEWCGRLGGGWRRGEGSSENRKWKIEKRKAKNLHRGHRERRVRRGRKEEPKTQVKNRTWGTRRNAKNLHRGHRGRRVRREEWSGETQDPGTDSVPGATG